MYMVDKITKPKYENLTILMIESIEVCVIPKTIIKKYVVCSIDYL